MTLLCSVAGNASIMGRACACLSLAHPLEWGHCLLLMEVLSWLVLDLDVCDTLGVLFTLSLFLGEGITKVAWGAILWVHFTIETLGVTTRIACSTKISSLWVLEWLRCAKIVTTAFVIRLGARLLSSKLEALHSTVLKHSELLCKDIWP